MMGADGAFTLLLSGLVILLTGGLSWLLVTARVTQVALRTSNLIAPVDWIMVLGRHLLGSAVTLDYAARLNRAAAVAAAVPQAKILVLVGDTSEGPFTEAEQGRRYLIQRGISAERIHTEDRSRHTLENLQQALTVLGDEPGRLLLITSRFHLARSKTMAAGFGISVQPCAAESEFHWSPGSVARLSMEGLYLHWYWVGRLWSMLTRNHKSLARIR